MSQSELDYRGSSNLVLVMPRFQVGGCVSVTEAAVSEEESYLSEFAQDITREGSGYKSCFANNLGEASRAVNRYKKTEEDLYENLQDLKQNKYEVDYQYQRSTQSQMVGTYNERQVTMIS